jgi:hypothetical protein
MSNVSGTISVNVEFLDTTTSSGVQSMKTVTLRNAKEYTTGNVAIVTGTVGTATIQVNPANLGYKNSTGNAVQFTSVHRIAFVSTGDRTKCFFDDLSIESSNGLAAICNGIDGEIINIETRSGTASYTIVLYGT